MIIGPGLWTLDLALSKDVHITERVRLNLRGDFFNALNHTNFENPSVAIFPQGAAGTTNVITSSGDPRLIQLSARIMF